uniref:Uncharacterized protein n=1 Tax=Anopheles maculatus TaxID=74869 RepID=A0A182SBL1_9DIPT
MKREPPTFPRKYKRRRKLKPHELERLQSGRRKQKNKRRDDETDELDEAGYEESNSAKESVTNAFKTSPSVSNQDGALKNKRSDALREGKRRLSAHDMLHANGINLLSNIVLLHGQHEEEGPSNYEPDNLPPESPVETSRAKPAQPSSSSSARSIIVANATKSKAAGAAASARKKPSRKRSSTSFATKDSPKPGVLKLADDGEGHSGGSMITNVMEAFFRSRKRNSLLPEIPPHRISSVSFPLLDDGNTDDAMDEPTAMVDQSRKSTTSFSASDDQEFNQQLLMEISHKNKYTDRFNSDTVHDLEEILRSPIKSVPPKQTMVQKGKGKAKNKRTAAAPSLPKRAPKVVAKKVKKEVVPQTQPPAVLRSQRLTRRQLEREVNFLKEAYETNVPSQAPESGKQNDPSPGTSVLPSEASDSTTSVKAVNGTPEREDSSE